MACAARATGAVRSECLFPARRRRDVATPDAAGMAGRFPVSGFRITDFEFRVPSSDAERRAPSAER